MNRLDQELIPEEALLSERHEYVIVNQDVARVGISHIAADRLSTVVSIELPEVGQIIEQGDPLATLETETGEMEVFSPVSGEVVSINDALVAEPLNLTHDSYGLGWLVEISPSDAQELSALMSPEAYLQSIAG
ncbi:MAG: biotin/lipoyl-containing protein [Vampirovibrionales bacterium]|nr:biotin/lipoyl-containing protein [Vampirovibrionales bacterium]